MKVELVGTGAIYSKYNSACTLVNGEMLVDVPNGVLKQLINSHHYPEKIDKILITHMHGDHIADIPFLLIYLTISQKWGCSIASPPVNFIKPTPKSLQESTI